MREAAGGATALAMQHMRGARKLLNQRLEALLAVLVHEVPVLVVGVLGAGHRELVGQDEGDRGQAPAPGAR